MKSFSHSAVGVLGIGLVCLMVGCASTESGEVGSRAVPSFPTKQGQLPTFPQKFDVQGPEANSFGFAVTQPGPVIVDVQSQGPPVIVTLEGPVTQPISQQGTGQVRLTYTVTAQNVQTSVLWSVKIKLATPIPLQQGGRSSGTVMIQHPPVNQTVAQAQAATLTAQRAARGHQPDSQAQARMDAAFHEHKSNFEQEQQQRHVATRAQAQPVIDQIRNQMSPQGHVRPRGIEELQPGETPAQSEGDVGTRGLRSNQTMSILQQQPLTETPFLRSGTTPLTPVPVPVPTITQLNITQGQPLQPVIVTGKNFGAQSADVVFQVGPNALFSGRVEAWSDAMIVVDVPDQSGFLQFDGKVYVSIGTVRSNEAPFRFVPAQETREIRWTNDMVLVQPGMAEAAYRDIYHPNTTFLSMGGAAGNDVLFPSTRLKNGWVVQGAWSTTANCLFGACGGVYVADFRPGTDTPFVNMRWWYDAFHSSSYFFGVRIVGPRGVPDGVVVP